MSEIAIFSFEPHRVRVVIIDGQPWFVAADVCEVLGISNNRDAVGSLDEDERITVANPDSNPRAGIPHQLTAVSESGLYALIFKSRKPEAKRFRRWVTQEVLPAIRRTGTYTKPATEGIREPTARQQQRLREQAQQGHELASHARMWCRQHGELCGTPEEVFGQLLLSHPATDRRVREGTLPENPAAMVRRLVEARAILAMYELVLAVDNAGGRNYVRIYQENRPAPVVKRRRRYKQIMQRTILSLAAQNTELRAVGV